MFALYNVETERIITNNNESTKAAWVAMAPAPLLYNRSAQPREYSREGGGNEDR